MAVCPNGHDSASDDFCDVCGMRILSPASASPSSGSSPPGSSFPGSSPPSSAGAAASSSSGNGSQATGPDQYCPVCATARSGQFCESCGFNFASAQASFPSAPPSPPIPSTPQAPQAPPPAPASSATPFPSVSWDPPVMPGPDPTEISVPVTPPPAAPPPPPPAPPISSAPPTAAAPPSYAPADWTAVVSADRDYYESVRAASGPDGQAIPFPAYVAERRFRLSGGQMQIGRRSVSRGVAPEIDLTGPPADPGISRLHAVLIAEPDGSWSVLDPGSANGTSVNGTEIPTGNRVPLYDGDRINVGAWTAITVHRG
jgi:FHA domain